MSFSIGKPQSKANSQNSQTSNTNQANNPFLNAQRDLSPSNNTGAVQNPTNQFSQSLNTFQQNPPPQSIGIGSQSSAFAKPGQTSTNTSFTGLNNQQNTPNTNQQTTTQFQFTNLQQSKPINFNFTQGTGQQPSNWLSGSNSQPIKFDQKSNPGTPQNNQQQNTNVQQQNSTGSVQNQQDGNTQAQQIIPIPKFNITSPNTGFKPFSSPLTTNANNLNNLTKPNVSLNQSKEESKSEEKQQLQPDKQITNQNDQQKNTEDPDQTNKQQHNQSPTKQTNQVQSTIPKFTGLNLNVGQGNSTPVFKPLTGLSNNSLTQQQTQSPNNLQQNQGSTPVVNQQNNQATSGIPQFNFGTNNQQQQINSTNNNQQQQNINATSPKLNNVHTTNKQQTDPKINTSTDSTTVQNKEEQKEQNQQPLTTATQIKINIPSTTAVPNQNQPLNQSQNTQAINVPKIITAQQIQSQSPKKLEQQKKPSNSQNDILTRNIQDSLDYFYENLHLHYNDFTQMMDKVLEHELELYQDIQILQQIEQKNQITAQILMESKQEIEKVEVNQNDTLISLIELDNQLSQYCNIQETQFDEIEELPIIDVKATHLLDKLQFVGELMTQHNILIGDAFEKMKQVEIKDQEAIIERQNDAQEAVHQNIENSILGFVESLNQIEHESRILDYKTNEMMRRLQAQNIN